MKKYVNQIAELAKEHAELIESRTPATEDQIHDLTERLGLAIPDDYRQFLLAFGTLDIGGLEIIGAADVAYLNVAALRADILSNFDMPHDLLPIQNEDGDSYVCLRPDGQVVRWVAHGGNIFPLEETLGEYLLRLCEELIEDEG